MKAISLWQPWASAIALGMKRIETRGWSTNYRGRLAIHAAKTWRTEQREFLAHAVEFGYAALAREPLPFGAIVATCMLTDVRGSLALRQEVFATELFFGDFGPYRFGWILDDIVQLAEPIPFKGRQGFFDVPDELVPEYARQLPRTEAPR
jgi:hypothetical protein